MDEEMRELLTEQLAELRVIRSQLDAVESTYKQIAEKLGMTAKKAAGSNLAAGLGKTLGNVLSKAKATAVAAAPRSASKKKTTASAPEEKPTRTNTKSTETDTKSTKTDTKSTKTDLSPANDTGVMEGVKNAAITLLLESSKSMNFEDVFAKLRSSGVRMPAEKPKLIVRRLLYNTKYFSMHKGYFSLKEGVRPTSGSAPEEAASPPDVPATDAAMTSTSETTHGDEMLVLDSSARMEGAASASQELPEEDVPVEPASPEPDLLSATPLRQGAGGQEASLSAKASSSAKATEDKPEDEPESKPVPDEPVPVEPEPAPAPAPEPQPVPEPEPKQDSPPPPRPKPAGDMFTHRLEAILGTDAKVRVTKPESKS